MRPLSTKNAEEKSIKIMAASSPRSPESSWWIPNESPPLRFPLGLEEALRRPAHPFSIVRGRNGEPLIGWGGMMCRGASAPPSSSAYPLLADVHALHPAELGAATFRARHGLKYAYCAGAMAKGIASTDLVQAMAREGMMGVFGAAGLDLDEVHRAIRVLRERLGTRPHGFNLIHSPGEPALEDALVDLYVREGVGRVSASAYLKLTPALVRYRLHGIHVDPRGRVVVPNRVIAKVSRVEVASRFLAPPPEELLRVLVEQGHLTAEQARCAREVPVAEDLIAEADSGGHTDNRSPVVLLPILMHARDLACAGHRYRMPIHVGLAGGLSTPISIAAAFAMGADFVVTGSINQACVEAGTSAIVRRMLAEAQQADVMMAPAADMFELGVQVQVLKRGTMFGLKARRLYELYRRHESLEDIPPPERSMLERDYFRSTLEDAWERTRAFLEARDPARIERASRDPKYRMALVFRSYLGQASGWANVGDPSRRLDYQIWCGPAMGAFNQWVKGSFLERPDAREAAVVALNLMYGASRGIRLNRLAHQGIDIPLEMRDFRPLPRDVLLEILDSAGIAKKGEQR